MKKFPHYFSSTDMTTLLLAPSVVVMRLPLLMDEMTSGSPGNGRETKAAVNEKTHAAVDGLAAANVAFVSSAIDVALQLARGKSPVNEMIYALPRAYQAALKPTTKRLRQNYKRLTK